MFLHRSKHDGACTCATYMCLRWSSAPNTAQHIRQKQSIVQRRRRRRQLIASEELMVLDCMMFLHIWVLYVQFFDTDLFVVLNVNIKRGATCLDLSISLFSSVALVQRLNWIIFIRSLMALLYARCSLCEMNDLHRPKIAIEEPAFNTLARQLIKFKLLNNGLILTGFWSSIWCCCFLHLVCLLRRRWWSLVFSILDT